MKNKSDYAVAVRKPDGEIQVEKGKCKSDEDRARVLRLPVIRGVVNFASTLVLGMKTLTISASFYEEEEKEAEKKNKESKDKDKDREQAAKERRENIEMVLTVILSVALAVGLFMVLPFFLSQLLNAHIASKRLLALIEGIIRVVLFVGYVLGISMMSDIRRVFMYHGAEHKSINCIENGFPLTVQNVRRQSKHHRRCGTSFLLFVMFLSILFFMFISFDNMWLRLLSRILIVPVIAGVSYEFIRFAGNSDNAVVIALSKPGMYLQRLTTREPDDEMIEVAIASVNAVFDWEGYLGEQREQRLKSRGKGKSGKKEKVKAVKSGKHGRKVENDKTKATAKEAKTIDKEQTADGENSGIQLKKGKSADRKREAKEEKQAEKEKNKVPEGKKQAEKEKNREKSADSEMAAMGEKWFKKEKNKGKPDGRDKAAEEHKQFGREKAAKAGKEKEKKKKSRAAQREELARREEEYRNRANERAKFIKEQEEREAKLEKIVEQAMKNKAARHAMQVEKQEEDDEILANLDFFFDDGAPNKTGASGKGQDVK